MIGINGVEIEGLKHIPKNIGESWYVDMSVTASGPGFLPHTAFKTIAEALTACVEGDTIYVKAGTYDEHGLDLDTNGVELLGEIGVLINNTNPGTCLTVSGDTCLIKGIVVQQAGQVGFAITGEGCTVEDCTSSGNTIAFDIDGLRTTLIKCKDQNATVTGYDIATQENTLYLCNTLASGGTSRGFYLSNTAADSNMLYQCVSIGNVTAGYEIVAGCSGNVFAYCVSGGGDGVMVDADEASVFSNYSFDNNINKSIDITQAGAGTWEYNLFKVTGTVIIKSITGIVEEVLVGSNSACYLQVYSVNGNEVITKATGTIIGAALVGSFVGRVDDDGSILAFHDAAGPGMIDSVDASNQAFRVIEDRTGAAHVDTYVRFIHTTDGASSGEIDWYVDWAPVSDDGFLSPV